MADPITDLVVAESGRILDWSVASRVFPGNPILGLMPRGTLPQGMGQDFTVITHERSAPTTANPSWTRVATVDLAEGGQCLPATNLVKTGKTTRTFYLYQTALEGEAFCAVDLWRAGGLEAQLDAISRALAGYLRIMWELHDQDEYFKLCKYKVICVSDSCPAPYSDSMDASWTDAATTIAAGDYGSSPCPSATLGQGELDNWRIWLIRDGAAKSAMGMSDGGPILTLFGSAETLYQIKHQVSQDHIDIRYSKPSELLAPYGGGERNWKGYYHIEIPFPRRFSCSEGTYTQIAAWTMGNATKGEKAEINSSWRTASYEETVIFDPSVMTQLIPQPVVNPAMNFKFDPVNYTGDWKMMNIIHKVDNPDGNIIYPRCVMASASQPRNPEMGVAFMHLRCDPACNLVTSCTT